MPGLPHKLQALQPVLLLIMSGWLLCGWGYLSVVYVEVRDLPVGSCVPQVHDQLLCGLWEPVCSGLWDWLLPGFRHFDQLPGLYAVPQLMHIVYVALRVPELQGQPGVLAAPVQRPVPGLVPDNVLLKTGKQLPHSE